MMEGEEKRKNKEIKAVFNDSTVPKTSEFDSQHITDDLCLGDRNIKLSIYLLLSFSIFNLHNANTHISMTTISKNVKLK